MRPDQAPDITVPLDPFSNSWVGAVPTGIPMSALLTVLFFIVFIMWAIYSVVVSFHWFRYAHKSWLTVPILVLYFFVSGMIILFMISGLR